MRIFAHVPVQIVSVANMREHWASRARRSNTHRESAHYALMAVSRDLPKLPLVVTLTRLQPSLGRHMDSDNLASACKAVRDGVADYLAVDDGDPAIEWRYRQRRANGWGCEVLIEKGKNGPYRSGD
jgi:hypothetical protein